MAKGEVKFDFTANGAGVFRVTSAIKKEISGVKHHVEHELGGIKDALLAAIGVGTIVEMVSSAIEFGKELRRSADELGTSLDRAQQLNDVMEHIGKNSGDLVMAMGKVQRFMGEAYEDASKMDMLKKFGIGTEDFKDFNFDRILRKFLEASKTVGKAETQMAGNLIFGKGMGAALLYGRERFLAPTETTGLREEELRQLDETTAKFKELKDAISVLLIKAITPLTSWLVDFLNRNKIERAITRFPEVYTGMVIQEGIEKKFGKNIFSTILGNLLRHGFRISEEQKAKAELEGKVANPVTNLGKERLGPIGGRNPFVAIGGLMGTDINYRIERLQERVARAAEETANNTAIIAAALTSDTASPPTVSSLPNYAGVNLAPSAPISSNTSVNQPPNLTLSR